MKKEIYLIADCVEDFNRLFPAIRTALQGGADKVQLFHARNYNRPQITEILECCNLHNAKLLIHEDVEFAVAHNCHGVHFDSLPDCGFSQKTPSSFITGVTVGNDGDAITKAVEFPVDYISFCSLYPTESAPGCELVDKNIIMNTAKNFNVRIYVAGGIKKEHLEEIKKWPVAGIAMISGILDACDIKEHVRQLKQKLNS